MSLNEECKLNYLKNIYVCILIDQKIEKTSKTGINGTYQFHLSEGIANGINVIDIYLPKRAR